VKKTEAVRAPQPHHAVEAPHSWIREIEERIRLKAGNTVLKTEVRGQKSETRTQKTEHSAQTKDKTDAQQGTVFGSGLTEADVERLLKKVDKK
ncbi:MAG TPA: hypothetical protein VIL52_07485, partial [Bacteroidota bacterium]